MSLFFVQQFDHSKHLGLQIYWILDQSSVKAVKANGGRKCQARCLCCHDLRIRIKTSRTTDIPHSTPRHQKHSRPHLHLRSMSPFYDWHVSHVYRWLCAIYVGGIKCLPHGITFWSCCYFGFWATDCEEHLIITENSAYTDYMYYKCNSWRWICVFLIISAYICKHVCAHLSLKGTELNFSFITLRKRCACSVWFVLHRISAYLISQFSP